VLNTTYILAAVIMFFATFIMAIGGFGGGIFAMSLFFIIFKEIKVPTVAFAFAGSLSFFYLAWKIRHEIPFKQTLSVGIGMIAGSAAGVYLLGLPIDIWAKGLLTVIIIFISLKELVFPDKEKKELPDQFSISLFGGLGLGTLSGVINGWINMGGPPLILYAYKKFEGKTARKFLITAFLIGIPPKLVMYFADEKLITKEMWVLTLYLIPGCILGTVLGNLIQEKIKKELFIKIVWITLLGLGLILGVNTVLKTQKSKKLSYCIEHCPLSMYHLYSPSGIRMDTRKNGKFNMVSGHCEAIGSKFIYFRPSVTKELCDAANAQFKMNLSNNA
jgi:uncharacterized membrane protein YfcA